MALPLAWHGDPIKPMYSGPINSYDIFSNYGQLIWDKGNGRFRIYQNYQDYTYYVVELHGTEHPLRREEAIRKVNEAMQADPLHSTENKQMWKDKLKDAMFGQSDNAYTEVTRISEETVRGWNLRYPVPYNAGNLPTPVIIINDYMRYGFNKEIIPSSKSLYSHEYDLKKEYAFKNAMLQQQYSYAIVSPSSISVIISSVS